MNPQHYSRNQIFASILYMLPSSLSLLAWLQGIDGGLIGQQGFIIDILNQLLFRTFV